MANFINGRGHCIFLNSENGFHHTDLTKRRRRSAEIGLTCLINMGTCPHYARIKSNIRLAFAVIYHSPSPSLTIRARGQKYRLINTTCPHKYGSHSN